MLCNYFFSSRRRHTRLQGDWSSDVCSSDLCLPQSPPPCAPQTWWSPPDRRAVSFVGGHDRRGRPVPPSLACGALPEKSRRFRCPGRRRRGIGRYGNASTGSRDAIPPPFPPPSEPAWAVVPDNERDGRKHQVED